MDKLLLVLSLLLPGVLCDIPGNFDLTSYNLQLAVPSDPTKVVNGTVTISLTCTVATNTIVLHWGSSLAALATTDLTINTGTTTVTISGTSLDTYNKLAITCAQTFSVTDVVTVIVRFKTNINLDNKGLFYRQYPVQNNQNNVVYLTNLHPTYARELFPCLDEPQYSAPLTLALTYPTSWGVAATATVASSTSDTTTRTTTTNFNSVTLPANNFALFLAENMVQMPYSVDRSSTRLSFWSRQGLALSIFSANIQFLGEYYYMVEDIIGTTLPLQQLTIVMVPGLEEPIAGYGVIFIREYNYAQDYSTPQMEGLYKTNVAPIIYQFLRQFSEFSTRPSSWSDYWVSQAIAKYLQFTVLNTVMPILDFKTDLEVVARQTSLFLDSQLGTKPLQDTSVSTDSSASVQALVNDPLKSLKGAFLLNMLDQSLPAGTVFAAIKSFLTSNRGALITSTAFNTAIQNIASMSQLPISTNASAALSTTLGYWFNSTKYPLVAVKLYRSGTPGIVNFTTTEFCSAINSDCTAGLPAIYYVSATVGTSSDNRYYTPRQDLWVNSRDSYVSTTINVQDADWIVANMKSGGYYRSSYNTDNWEHIIAAVSSRDVHLLGRTQLLDDAFALPFSSTGPLDFNITLRLALANLGNTLYRDWVPVQRGLHNIQDSLLGLPIYSSYQNFAAGYFLNLNGFLQNTSSDAFEMARIQALFLDDFCEYDITGYRASAVGNLTNLLRGILPSTVPSSVYDALACCGARYNSTIKAQPLWNILADSTIDFYPRHFASVALGCLSNYTDIAQLYSTMSTARIQLKPYIMKALQNVADKNPVNFLADFSQQAERFQSQLGAVSVASLILRAGRKVNNNTQVAVLDALNNNANVDTLVKTAASTTTNTVNLKLSWLYRNNVTLVRSLQIHSFPSGASSSGNVLSVISLLALLPSLLFALAPLSVN